MIKTEIKLQVTPEQSAKVQQICFNAGIYWRDSSSDIKYTDNDYLFIHSTYITRTRGLKIFFKEHEFKEVDPELFIATNGSCEGVLIKINGKSLILSHNKLVDINNTGATKMENKNKSENIAQTKFEEYGFETPDFECKIYDKLDDYILGAYFNPNKQKWTMCRWNFQGVNKQGSSNYSLKPIIKPWYETCKFPILVKDRDNCIFNLTAYSDAYIYNCTPLTDAEIEALKRGF